MNLPKKLVVATGNRGKLKEIAYIWRRYFPDVELCGLWEFGDLAMPDESGKTYEANARAKAVWVAKGTGMSVLADDSGLEVEALGKLPGVKSARFAGKNSSDQDNNRLLLSKLDGTPWYKRRAIFVCVAVFAEPNGKVTAQARGECKGFILASPRGEVGFGYDPLFWVPKYKKTFAELPLEIKNAISHRAKAFSKLAEMLKNG